MFANVRRLMAVASFVLSLGLAPAAPVFGAETVIGQPAGALALTTLDGKSFDLAALRGKVVLVTYWATWCEPCREEMPALSSFYRLNHARGLEIIGISVDRAKDRPAVIKASRKLGYATAMLSDISSNGLSEPDGVPFTWVVDANGVVRDKLIAADRPLLERLVLPLLAPEKH